jgi:hypothetical protein
MWCTCVLDTLMYDLVVYVFRFSFSHYTSLKLRSRIAASPLSLFASIRIQASPKTELQSSVRELRSFSLFQQPLERCLPSSLDTQCNMTNEKLFACSLMFYNWWQKHALQCHASRPIGARDGAELMHRATHKHSGALYVDSSLFTSRSVLLCFCRSVCFSNFYDFISAHAASVGRKKFMMHTRCAALKSFFRDEIPTTAPSSK